MTFEYPGFKNASTIPPNPPRDNPGRCDICGEQASKRRPVPDTDPRVFACLWCRNKSMSNQINTGDRSDG